MNKTCGTCKYKGRELDENGRTPYDDAPTGTGYFRCTRASHLEPWTTLKSVSKFFVADASGYYAALCVEDDFGCTEWEEKK